jgi:ubiquinone/menaquinone biosynthesis C-methylase UbiE
LQDLWELGADPDTMIGMISKHFKKNNDLTVLDLGCGKGAISVKLSHRLGCTCYGIDAIPEFIAFAQQKASELKVSDLCTFETGDVRYKVLNLSGFNVIILGAIGPVFGDYFSTLSTLKKCMQDDGIILIDDGYVDEHSGFSDPAIITKTALMQQIEAAGMYLAEEVIMDRNSIKESNEFIYSSLKKRCYELIEKFPENKSLFQNYIRLQEIENEVLENRIIGTTLMIKNR